MYTARREYEKSEETFNRALEVDKDDLPVLNELARIFVVMKGYEKAEVTYKQILEVKPNDLFFVL